MLLKFLWNASERFQFQHDFRECPALKPLILLMNRLLHGILLWNLTTCLEQLFYRTLHNSCFCHLISFRTTLSMIHVKKACSYIFPRLFVVLPLRPLVHNGSTFVCCRVQSPVCHSQKMMAETREAIIIFHFYRFSLHAAWVILNNQESIFVQIWSSFGQHLWIKNFFCKINLSIFSP